MKTDPCDGIDQIPSRPSLPDGPAVCAERPTGRLGDHLLLEQREGWSRGERSLGRNLPAPVSRTGIRRAKLDRSDLQRIHFAPGARRPAPCGRILRAFPAPAREPAPAVRPGSGTDRRRRGGERPGNGVSRGGSRWTRRPARRRPPGPGAHRQVSAGRAPRRRRPGAGLPGRQPGVGARRGYQGGPPRPPRRVGRARTPETRGADSCRAGPPQPGARLRSGRGPGPRLPRDGIRPRPEPRTIRAVGQAVAGPRGGADRPDGAGLGRGASTRRPAPGRQAPEHPH